MAQLPYDPTNNTPEAAVTRGEGFYRLYEYVTGENTPDNSLTTYFSTTENVVAISLGPDSTLDTVQIQYVDKGGVGSVIDRFVTVSVHNPWVGVIPSIPNPGGTNQSILITPNITFDFGAPGGQSYILDLILWFRMPPVLPVRRTPKSLTSVNTAEWKALGAGATSTSFGARYQFGTRKLAIAGSVSAAVAVTFTLTASRTAVHNTLYTYETIANTLYTYTTNGSADDGFSATLNVDGTYQTYTLSVTKAGGIATDVRAYIFGLDD